MRDWNEKGIEERRDCATVCSLPMRDWNESKTGITGNTTTFVVYLWGIETETTGLKPYLKGHVCSLPMRDWNDILTSEQLAEWEVCSLPMRDWNSPYQDVLHWTLQFVVYLWGIETSVNARLKGYCPWVCSLPMRDWNSIAPCKKRIKYFVCSLPMRDWNVKSLKNNISPFLVCSLPMRDWNNLPTLIIA